MLTGLEGVIVHIDDVLVYGKTQGEHDNVLKRIESAGGTLNKDKCEFSKETLTFLGHVVGKQGVSSDPDKTRAIVEMEQPKTLKELRRFMGMANQLGKFNPNLAECSQPLRELLSPRKSWVWGPAQEGAYQKVKEELTKPTVLALYNPNAMQDKDPCRCLRIWTRCCLATASRERGLEANCIRFQVHVGDRETLLTDQERGPCSSLGL